MSAQHWAWIIRRYDGRLLPVLGCDDRTGVTYLHIHGAAVDFWAAPAELHRRGYRLVMARPHVWDVWGRGCVDGIAVAGCGRCSGAG